jgi:methionyl-tRNA formyltransferase
MKIVFMGTSEFAVPTLEKLLSLTNHEILAVYTKEPSVSGRGNKLQVSPIHHFANQNNLKIFTPKTLREPSIQKEFHDLNPDIAIVISYGLILPVEILNIPKFGCFNVHPSKLPLYRGSAPLQRSIMNGEKESAVCVIKMDSGVDSGDIVNQEDFSILDSENYPDISKKTADIGASLIIKTLNQIADKSIKFHKQNEKLATFAKKIEKNECLIDWNNSCEEIFNKIRGLNGNLDAFFNYNNEKIKILECAFFKDENIDKNLIGTIFDKDLSIVCKEGLIKPLKLQKAGKNSLKIHEFLNGFKVEIGKNCA